MSRYYLAQELSCIMKLFYDARAPAIRAFLVRFAARKNRCKPASKLPCESNQTSGAVDREEDVKQDAVAATTIKLRRLTLEVDAARPVVLLEVLAQLQTVLGGIQIPLVQTEREEVLRVEPVRGDVLEDVVLRALPP